jgi:4-carboxymuconolactone decarboxylase
MEANSTAVDYGQRRRRGLALYREIMGVDHQEPTTPRAESLIDFVYGEIWSRPGISRRERRLVTLACLAGADAHDTLGAHYYGALVTGDLDHDELLEFVLHFTVYCGWGKGEAAERTLEEQWARWHAERGTSAPARTSYPTTAIAANQDQRARDGEEEFCDVNWGGAPPRGVPYYHGGILNYVFGDMWKRPGLSRRDRRWITLACVGLDDTLVPVQSHVYSALRSGDIGYDELREMVLQFAAYSGWPKASYMQQTVDQMWARVQDEGGPGGENPHLTALLAGR